MNKALMISIRPEHAVNILNGKKTLELRTWIPKGYVGWVYVYVKKGIGKTKYHHLYNLTEYNNGKTLFSITHHNKHSLVPDDFLNSKVVFRFWFDEYDTYNYEDVSYPEGYEDYDGTFVDTTNYVNGYYVLNTELEKLCLSYDEIETYGNGKTLYAWHIKKLEVFDTPKELSEFESRTPYKNKDRRIVAWGHRPIIRAPQKMQWVYAKELENE